MRHKNVVDISKQKQRNSDHDECCDDDGDGDSDGGDGGGDDGGDDGGEGGDCGENGGDMVGRMTEKYEQRDSLGSCDCFGMNIYF